MLDPIGNQTVDELVELAFTATATDADLPANTLTFSLGDAAPTAWHAIDPTRVPSAGPRPKPRDLATYDVTVTVTTASRPMTETITITVNEVNVAPVLDPIGDQSVDELVELAFTATATDADLPANTLTFSLGRRTPQRA